MSDKKHGTWNPIFHEYDYPEDQNPQTPSISADDICPRGGLHTIQHHSQSIFRPDGDPAWTKYQCKKCGKIDVYN
jgi:hypothetical protein